MRAFVSQFFSVATLGVRTLPSRASSVLMTLVGISGVVAALMVVLSIAVGLESVMSVSESSQAVIVMRAGSDFELASSLGSDAVDAIAQAPGLARTSRGPLLSTELLEVVDVAKVTTGTDAHIPLRGVQGTAPDIRDGFRIVQGRLFEPGTHELVAGIGLVEQYEGLVPGSTKSWNETTWRIVGTFTTGGTAAESELWGDIRVLQGIYGYGSAVDTVHAKLQTSDSFDAFAQALAADVRANVSVERYVDFYGKQSETLTGMLRWVGGVAGLLMATCAAFGALNTMYAAVAARTREIATLRALGFSATPTVMSVLIESLTIAAVGGGIGVAIAHAGFDGLQASTMNWATYTQVAFSFEVTGGLALQGIGYALAIGFVGGLLPALRAARLPVAAALRDG